MRSRAAVATTALFLVTLVGSACAPVPPAPPLYWYKDGATQQDYYRDDYQCRRETSVTSYDTYRTPPSIFFPGGVTTTTPSTEVDQNMYVRCMAARGYSLQPASQPSSPTPAQAPSVEPGKKSDTKAKDVPLCAWGEYWHSVKKQCVKIGSE